MISNKKKHCFYPLTVFLFASIILYSCQSGSGHDDTTFPNSPDSVTLLHGTGSMVFDYGSGNDTLVQKTYYVRYAAHPLEDTCFLTYGANKKVVNAVIKLYTSSYYHWTKLPVFGVYVGDKLIKVYRKPEVSIYADDEYDDPAYCNTLGPTDPSNFNDYDSIAYDSRSRVSKVYHYGSNGQVYQYDQFTYNSPGTYNNGGDSLVYLIEKYTDQNYTGTFSLAAKAYFSNYDLGKVNPLYKAFKEYCFFLAPRFSLDTQPTDLNDDGLSKYISLNPYPLNRLAFKDNGTYPTVTITNTYDANGRLINASSTNFYTVNVGYSYIKKRK
ncbi:MAG: hypothetical protein ABI480_11675 [Chitinophagaceae bacterium]